MPWIMFILHQYKYDVLIGIKFFSSEKLCGARECYLTFDFKKFILAEECNEIEFIFSFAFVYMVV